MTLPIIPDGLGLDRALAAMFCRAKHGETISVMAARADVDGRRWGCVLCKLFDWIVEPGHCTLVLAEGDQSTRPAAAYRAGGLLLVVLAALWSVPIAVWELEQWLFGWTWPR